jgi:hypothetical protein
MEKIYKYPLEITDHQLVVLPIGARVLSVKNQDGVPTIWAMHSQDTDIVNVEVMLVGTGNEFELQDWRFIDTVVCDTFVWHVFMRE